MITTLKDLREDCVYASDGGNERLYSRVPGNVSVKKREHQPTVSSLLPTTRYSLLCQLPRRPRQSCACPSQRTVFITRQRGHSRGNLGPEFDLVGVGDVVSVEKGAGDDRYLISKHGIDVARRSREAGVMMLSKCNSATVRRIILWHWCPFELKLKWVSMTDTCRVQRCD